MTAADDSEKVVFTSDREGNFEIYTTNPDGSYLRRLTETTRTKKPYPPHG